VAHEFQAAPSSIGVQEGFSDVTDKAVGSAGERTAWLMIAVKGDFAGARYEACMIPDPAFVLLEPIDEKRLVGG
jgi:hypothetical protein